MEASELRELKPTDLRTRLNQWREELFRARLKKFGSEVKDSTAVRKLRRDIARGMTILGEKTRSEVQDKAVEATDRGN